jgi:hypothetical protein
MADTAAELEILTMRMTISLSEKQEETADYYK